MNSARTRILIFGTFDGIHEGHRNFFAQARALADEPFLIVSLARDSNVLKIKGKAPHSDDATRLESMRKEKLVDEAVLGTVGGNYIEHIVELKPDIIALGYDQTGTLYTNDLEAKLQSSGCSARVTRCEAFMPDIYKSSKLRQA